MNIPRTPKEIKEYHTQLQVLVNMDSGGRAGSWYSHQAGRVEWVQQHGFKLQWDALVYISGVQWQPGNKVAPQVTIYIVKIFQLTFDTLSFWSFFLHQLSVSPCGFTALPWRHSHSIDGVPVGINDWRVVVSTVEQIEVNAWRMWVSGLHFSWQKQKFPKGKI